MIYEAFNADWELDGKKVTLPHDAMIHEAREASAPGGSGNAYFRGGKYVYTRTFRVDEAREEKPVFLYFEGVYRKARVRVNGEDAGGCAYGYIPFAVDIRALVHPGENTVEVEADNSELPNSRWYSGSGIYRPVWLVLAREDHIAFEGVSVSTLSVSPARIRVVTRVEGSGTVAVEIEDPKGKIVAEGRGEDLTLEVPRARLWSEKEPELYTACVTLLRDGKPVDRERVRFGIRTVTWGPQGLAVNGESVLLRGGCIHHDSGILGAATYDEAERRRVRILRDAGFNALRMAHNPASRALLEACDELGMYVMDETWDMWYRHKTRFDYAEDFPAEWEKDVTRLTQRDRNHPSVIMYSIGNEVSEPADEKGLAQGKAIIDLFHRLDPTRPVTGGFNLLILASTARGKPFYREGGNGPEDKKPGLQGMNSTLFNLVTSAVGTGMNKMANGKGADRATSPILDSLDIAGYNYASGRYAGEGKKHPGRVLVGSETFPQDIYRNWQQVKKLPYLTGDFMWTAWDYLGECGIGAWAYTPDAKGFEKPYPWLLADCGALDILGDPNGEMFLAQCAWGLLDTPKAAVRPLGHGGKKPVRAVWRGTNALPSWSWHGCDKEKATVEVYSEAPSVALEVNGKRTSHKKPKNGRALFTVPYEPGLLAAVSYNESGYAVSRCELRTAENPRLCLVPEKESVSGGEVFFVRVQVQSPKGIVESNMDRQVTLAVEGGELLAFGSARPRTEERFDSGVCTTYYGRALAAVRAGEKGKVTLRAVGGETVSAAVTIVRKG